MSDLIQIVRAIIDGMERGDPGPLLQGLSDQVEWYEAQNGPYWAGAAFVGRDAIVANVFARIPADFQDLHLHVRRIGGCKSTVLVEGRYSAISRATGQTLDAQVAHVWNFSGGKVTRWQQYTDTSQFARMTATAPR